MSSALLKYNPGFLRDEELISSFVVRVRDLNWVLEIISANTTVQANQHVLVVGPRGSGKTTLVRRVAAEVKSSPDLSIGWHPIMFSEESYSVSSPGEFWLETILQIYNDSGDANWKHVRDTLSTETDESRLRESALGQVLEYSDRLGKKLILIVENLNMLLAQLQTNSDWELRHTLLNESRIMLLGTATTRFSEIENVDRAWYELFATHELKPLNTKDSLALWKSYTGAKVPLRQVQALRILTGGNPRLFRILSDFVINASFLELMENLTRLIDEHTEYFKGSLDSLSALERKVFVALLERWDPSDARQIAIAARLDVSKTSALLGRLVEKGRVAAVSTVGKKRRYQVTERLFNIYYLMRRRGRPADRVRAFVRFMVQFYRDDNLVEMVAGIAREACMLGPDKRQDHYSAYAQLLDCGLDGRLCSKILGRTQPEFFQDEHAPSTLRRLAAIANLPEVTAVSDVSEMLQKAVLVHPNDSELHVLLARITEQKPESEMLPVKDLERSDRNDAQVWAWLAQKLHDLELFEDALLSTQKAVVLDPQNVAAWQRRGELLSIHFGNDGDSENKTKNNKEAETSLKKALELDSNAAWIHGLLASVFRNRGDMAEAEKEAQIAVDLDQNAESSWSALGAIKLRQHNLPEAEKALRRALEIFDGEPFTWGELGLLLSHYDDRKTEAVAAFRRALQLDETDRFAWSKLLRLTARRGTTGETLSLIEEMFRALGRDWNVVHLAAWTVNDVNLRELFPKAMGWVRDAMAAYPDHWQLGLVLASLLANSEDWKSAIESAQMAIIASARSEDALKLITDFLISAAAKGHAGEVLASLGSNGNPSLEPLEIGLRLYLGEKPIIAQEVMDVGEDVAKRIREAEIKIQREMPMDRSIGNIN